MNRTMLVLIVLAWNGLASAPLHAQYCNNGNVVNTDFVKGVVRSIGLGTMGRKAIWAPPSHSVEFWGTLYKTHIEDKQIVYLAVEERDGKPIIFWSCDKKQAVSFGHILLDKPFTYGEKGREGEPQGWYHFVLKDSKGKIWYLSSGERQVGKTETDPKQWWPVTMTTDVKLARPIWIAHIDSK